MSSESPFPSRAELHRTAQPIERSANDNPQPEEGPGAVPSESVDGNGAKRPRRSAGRMAVQITGELLITIGLVMALFIVWQLWWTTVKVQGGMIERVQTFQAENPSSLETTDEQLTTDPPTVNPIGYGEVFGVLHVMKWGMQIPIAKGTSPEVLANGDAGHYEFTQMPGELGNFAIAGHRRTYGNNFRRIDIMEPGDKIVVETADAWIVYEVYDHAIVDPSAIEVVSPVPNQPGVEPTRRIMTMTTCHPEFGNTERYILWSEMQYWVPKAVGKPAILQGESGN